MLKKYTIALIGCGSMGGAHLDTIYLNDNFRIKYVCDLCAARAELYKRKYGAEIAETDSAKCISDPEVDIVMITTYPSSHLELLRECIVHKKHVMCEKPIAANRKDGEEFVRLVRRNPDCKVLVGYILRHNATYKKVAEMIQNGAIGKPIVMRINQNHHTEDWGRFLKLIEETSPIIDCGVHYVDVMRWFSQAEVVSVYATGARTEYDVPQGKYNYGMMNVRLSDGSVAYYEAGWSNSVATDKAKEFVGPKGRIRIIYETDRHTDREEGNLIEYYKYPQREYELINVPYDAKPTAVQLEYLVKMIEENVPAFPSIDDVEKSFDAVLKADEVIRAQ